MNEVRGQPLLKAVADGHEHLPAVLLDERRRAVGHEQRRYEREVDRRWNAENDAEAIVDVIAVEELDELRVARVEALQLFGIVFITEGSNDIILIELIGK